MKLYDITRTLSPDMAIYPGNPPVEFEVHEGETSTHTRIVLGTHTGTHVDAPRHVFRHGKGVDELSLEKLCGRCRIFDLRGVKEKITIADLEPYAIEKGERILVRTTNSERDFEDFYDDFVYLDGDCADYLIEKGICLFGIDYLSVKKKGGNDHRPHTSLLEKEIIILEGLDLRTISEGFYDLFALPLKLEGIDGASVRAILKEVV